nr:WhiB family transcriptional regulator [Actinomycetota bacterium]
MQASRLVRPFDIGADESGNYLCPYESCPEDFPTARGRISHMMKAHRLETEARLSAIEELLGGPWRERAACRNLDGFLTEPTSRDKKTARETGFREPTRGERRACAICAGCEVRRDCALASLQPIPASTELPMSTPTLYAPTGIWAGCRPEERRMTVEALGTGQDAVDALLEIGDQMARRYPP